MSENEDTRSIRITFQNIDDDADYLHAWLQAIPSTNERIFLAHHPKGTYVIIDRVEHHINSCEHRIIAYVRKYAHSSSL